MKKLFILSIALTLIVSIFTIDIFAASVTDTVTGEGLKGADADTKNYFYKANLGDANESVYDLEYYTRQKCKITKSYFLLFEYSSDTQASIIENLLANPQNYDFGLMNYEGKVYFSSVSRGSGGISTQYKNGPVYKQFNFVYAVMTLEYITNLGSLTSSDIYNSEVLPFSQNVGSYSLHFLYSGIGRLNYYVKPGNLRIDLINPTPSQASTYFSGWFIDRELWFWNQKLQRNYSSLTRNGSMNTSWVINGDAYGIPAANYVTSNLNLSVEYNLLSSVKSSEYTVSMKNLLFSGEQYFYAYIASDGSGNTVDSNSFSDFVSQTAFIYSNRTLFGGNFIPSGGNVDVDTGSYYVTPQNWYDFASHFNNLMVWITFESPILSIVLKPIVQFVSYTKLFYESYVISFTGSMGLLGTFMLFTFFFRFICKVIGGSDD